MAILRTTRPAEIQGHLNSVGLATVPFQLMPTASQLTATLGSGGEQFALIDQAGNVLINWAKPTVHAAFIGTQFNTVPELAPYARTPACCITIDVKGNYYNPALGISAGITPANYLNQFKGQLLP